MTANKRIFRYASVTALAVCVLTVFNAAAKQNAVKEILTEIETVKKTGKLPVIVIDLDDTIFSTSNRDLWIIKRFAGNIQQSHPKEAAALRKLTIGQMEYSFFANIKKAGVTDAALKEKFKNFWLRHFFSDLCEIDEPIPGAMAFVNEAYKRGALIVYLTGRDVERMYEGTVKSLYRNDLPLGVERTQLIMKPDKKLDDAKFKRSVTESIKKMGKVVAGFDNEPANINLFKKAFPKARIVFLKTRHSPKAEKVQPGIEKITDFLF